jgi:hypothetical protein
LFAGNGRAGNMSKNDLETAHGYRERAEELRRIADNFTHEGSRRDLLIVADLWERMAERLEPTPPAPALGPVTWLDKTRT